MLFVSNVLISPPIVKMKRKAINYQTFLWFRLAAYRGNWAFKSCIMPLGKFVFFVAVISKQINRVAKCVFSIFWRKFGYMYFMKTPAIIVGFFYMLHLYWSLGFMVTLYSLLSIIVVWGRLGPSSLSLKRKKTIETLI